MSWGEAVYPVVRFVLFGGLTQLSPSSSSSRAHTGRRTPRKERRDPSRTKPTLTIRQQLLAAAIPALLAGLGLLTIAVWLPARSLGVFLAGDLVIGAGSA